MDLLGRIRDDMAFESNVWKSYLYRFLMDFQLWLPIWVVYLQVKRGLSLTQITLLDTPFLLLIVFAEVPTGAIADRFGRRYSLMLGSGLFAVAIFIFGVADNYLVILASYTAWGLGVTFQSGADTAILYDSLKNVGREDDFQKINSRMWALKSLAALLAILIGAPIAQATNFTFPIILSAGIAVLGVPVAFLMHEPRHAAAESHEEYLSTLVNGLRETWDQPVLRYIILYSGILLAATFTPQVFQQPFLKHHGVSIADLGLWQAPVRVCGILASLFAYKFVSRVGQRGAFFALPAMLIVCNFALAGIDHSWIAVSFLGMGAVAGMQSPALATYINKRIPSERRATILSVQSVVGNFILAGMNPIAGIVADTFGLRAVFLLFAVLTLLVATPILFLWSRAEKEELAMMQDEIAWELERARKPVAV